MFATRFSPKVGGIAWLYEFLGVSKGYVGVLCLKASQICFMDGVKVLTFRPHYCTLFAFTSSSSFGNIMSVEPLLLSDLEPEPDTVYRKRWGGHAQNLRSGPHFAWATFP